MAPVPPQLGLPALPPLGDRLGQSHHDSDPGTCRSLSLPGLLSSPSTHLYHLIVCDRVLACHPSSLDYELLQGWNEPESSLPSAHDRTWLNVGAAPQIFVEFPSESNRKPSYPCLGMMLVETAFPDHPVCELTPGDAAALHAEHASASTTFQRCFPSDALDCWFYSSPFSLSVLENHKETPRCSWKSCQHDSNRLEHMAPSSRTNKDVATSSSVASLPLPAWPPPPPCPKERWRRVCPAGAVLTHTVPHGGCTQGWEARAVK